MKLNYNVDPESIKTSESKSPYLMILEEFIASGKEIAEVEIDIKTASVATNQFRQYIRQKELPIQANTYKGRVYLRRCERT